LLLVDEDKGIDNSSQFIATIRQRLKLVSNIPERGTFLLLASTASQRWAREHELM
jgi:hypothetical protein